ncbi:MAG: single-stranded DNA-binding protein [Alphaproteobacteria bacterium]|nr:MAG: single-stranded DNA-binding protein [Alphaproteobacteria bacterium]
MNTWNITGNLGKDAEVKTLPSGTTICEFSVAVKSGYGDKEKTNWANCVIFGKKAEGGLPGYLTKGTQVAISGELELQEWDTATSKGAKLAVVVNELDLIGGVGTNTPPQQAPQMAPQQAPQAAPQQQPPAQTGYFYETGDVMTSEHANWYRDAGHQPWAKGTKPPA